MYCSIIFWLGHLSDLRTCQQPQRACKCQMSDCYFMLWDVVSFFTGESHCKMNHEEICTEEKGSKSKLGSNTRVLYLVTIFDLEAVL